MNPVLGSLNLQLEDVVISEVQPCQAFLGAAEALMRGVKCLYDAGHGHEQAMTFLAGQVLECALKAFLAKTGTGVGRLKTIGHSIESLWCLAHSSGLVPSADLPDWVCDLHSLHSKFTLRYPLGLNGIVLPIPEVMVRELGELVERVGEAIRRID